MLALFLSYTEIEAVKNILAFLGVLFILVIIYGIAKQWLKHENKVWMLVRQKGRKLNIDSYLGSLNLLINLNSQELSTNSNYLIALLTIVIPLSFSFMSSPHILFVLAIITALLTRAILHRIGRIKEVNDLLVEQYNALQAKKAGCRLLLAEPNSRTFGKLVKDVKEREAKDEVKES